MRSYDFVIAGGGGAGLGLACALLDSPLRDASLLIVDRDAKRQNDRTWCFWGGQQTPYSGLARHSWRNLAVRSEGFERVFDLESAGQGWRYWMVSGLDYYNAARQKLASCSNVRWITGNVERIQDGVEQAQVVVDGEMVAAGWVFDSILRPGEPVIDPRRHHFIKQHFLGWEVESEQPVFNPGCATWFDFATPQANDLRFFYVLPFSETRALVEYTLFSADLLAKDEYEGCLRNYLADRLGISRYRILSEERNWIPMSDFPFKRRAGQRIMNIGTRGGLVKPSTGYAFQRMQRDAQVIVDSLVRHGHPFAVPRAPARYRLYDTLLLQILSRQGERMKPIFTRLFARNPIARILHFLDEDASLREDLSLIATLPPGPFSMALIKTKLLRRI